MKCNCTISGLEWKAEYLSAATNQAHPFLFSRYKENPSHNITMAKQSLNEAETHLLFTRLLLDTEHVSLKLIKIFKLLINCKIY